MSDVLKNAALAVARVTRQRLPPQGDVVTCEGIARAVLEAIREPSQAMLDAGEYDDNGPPGGSLYFGGENLRESWRRMIDAALSE